MVHSPFLDTGVFWYLIRDTRPSRIPFRAPTRHVEIISVYSWRYVQHPTF
jgi:hypothetical protein